MTTSKHFATNAYTAKAQNKAFASPGHRAILSMRRSPMKYCTSTTYTWAGGKMADDFSNYIWLFLTRTCGKSSAVKELTAWNVAFGLAKLWISDQGSHFKNEMLQKTAEALQTKHNFTSAYHAQSNGSVEAVCREVICGTRALI